MERKRFQNGLDKPTACVDDGVVMSARSRWCGSVRTETASNVPIVFARRRGGHCEILIIDNQRAKSARVIAAIREDRRLVNATDADWF